MTVAVGGEAFSVVVVVGINSTSGRSKSSSGSRFYQVASRDYVKCAGAVAVEVVRGVEGEFCSGRIWMENIDCLGSMFARWTHVSLHNCIALHSIAHRVCVT